MVSLFAALPAHAASSHDSGIVYNNTGNTNNGGQVYLNPQFRYQGSSSADGSRLRTMRIPQNMAGMVVGDFNGDGKNEVAILGNHDVAIYNWTGNTSKMQELGRQTVSRTNDTYVIRTIDLNRDGAMDLVICTYSEEDNRPYTFFYSFRGNRFTEVCRRVPYFVSVAKIPPYFTPTLIGQGWDSLKCFDSGVHVMEKSGDSYKLGQRIPLPKDANCFNFTYMPPSRESRTEQLIVLTKEERLKIFQGPKQTLVHTTMERFSGSAVGMDFYKSMPGLGVNKAYQMPSKYYAPMDLVTVDLAHNGEPVLLVNKPISTASQFFDRYRFFPQGEIHALYWDGVGMALKWKTRRIKGSVAAVAVADVNNDHILELVVGLNTAPELGIGGKQCMIVAYPLDMSKQNPNTPADMSEFEVQPN